MNVILSWDLFIIVFFVVIIAYSFIIGRDGTLKVILGTYVSMIAADASGALFGKYFAGSKLFMGILKMATVGNEQEAIVFVKVLIFVLLVILFAVRGAFDVETVDDRSFFIRIVLSVLYAAMSAALIVSAILVFISGVSFLGGDQSAPAAWTAYNQSKLIKLLLDNNYVLFSVPALSFLIHSFYSTRNE